MNPATDLRVCFVGDSLIAGVGDAEHLGWVGRAAADAGRNGFTLTTYNLGVRRETSTDIAGRWLQECTPRLPSGCQPHAVFSFGVNDTTDEKGRPRVPAERSVSHLNEILGAAKARYTILMIGPSPVADSSQNRRIGALCTHFSSACEILGVPYLPVFDALHANATWMRQVGENDGAHPRAEGYAALSSIVVEWNHWWFRSLAS